VTRLASFVPESFKNNFWLWNFCIYCEAADILYSIKWVLYKEYHGVSVLSYDLGPPTPLSHANWLSPHCLSTPFMYSSPTFACRRGGWVAPNHKSYYSTESLVLYILHYFPFTLYSMYVYRNIAKRRQRHFTESIGNWARVESYYCTLNVQVQYSYYWVYSGKD
jgi:hypothetical protein